MEPLESQLVQVDAVSIIEEQSRAEFDIQVATARRYPRDIQRALNNSIAIVTMDEETAKSCGYALPRGGKTITGPSVHMAKIIAQNWGNLRVAARVVSIDGTHVTSQGVCFDLEANIAYCVDVKRKITDKYGKRFNDDMITVTGNAANSIAMRNAILSVIPKSICDKVYKSAQEKIIGKLSTESELIAKRKKVFDGFITTYSVTENQVLALLGLRSINQVKQDELVQLIGIAQAIKDGDTTVEEAFGLQKEKEAKDSAKDIFGEPEQNEQPEQPKTEAKKSDKKVNKDGQASLL